MSDKELATFPLRAKDIMAFLIVNNETPIDLNGLLDGAGAMQFQHGSDVLVDYEQTLQCEHDTESTIRVKLIDFSGGGSSWTVNATHQDGGTQTWTRGSGHAYFDFTEEETTPLTVSVVATDGGSPPQQRAGSSTSSPSPSRSDFPG